MSVGPYAKYRVEVHDARNIAVKDVQLGRFSAHSSSGAATQAALKFGLTGRCKPVGLGLYRFDGKFGKKALVLRIVRVGA